MTFWTTYKSYKSLQNTNMRNEQEKQKLFGKNIAKYRKAKKLTQNQLSEKLDISRNYLSKIENGKKTMSLDLLFEIKDILEMSGNDMLEFN